MLGTPGSVPAYKQDMDIMLDTTVSVVGHPGTAIPVHCAYTPADPIAVTLAFGCTCRRHMCSGCVTWVFARDILADGLQSSPFSPAGVGDVCAWAHGEHLYLRLTGPEGAATFGFSAALMTRFITETCNQVPFDQESLHLGTDRAIAMLLGGTA